jgi:protein-disulfide isomerase
VFAHQPADEGTGWSDAQLQDFASSVGISGSALETFKTCYTSAKYASWVKNSYAAFESEGVAGTPAGYLNGTELTPDQLADPTTLAQLVAKATN